MHSFLRQRVRMHIAARCSEAAPGSSLPSGQSQKSSLTADHSMDFEPSRHCHDSAVPFLVGTYRAASSGRTPCSRSLLASTCKGRSRSSQGCIESVELGQATWNLNRVRHDRRHGHVTDVCDFPEVLLRPHSRAVTGLLLAKLQEPAIGSCTKDWRLRASRSQYFKLNLFRPSRNSRRPYRR